MSEWWTYTLSDFAMLSARSHARLVAQFNADRWPLQGLAMAAFAGLLLMALRHRRGPATLLAVLAAAWAGVAADFLGTRYARVHLAAPVLAGAFALQAVALGAAAAWQLRVGDGVPRARSLVPAALVLVGWPLAALRPPDGLGTAQWVGLFPDPTAVFTLCVLPALLSRRGALALSVLPLGACVASGVLLHGVIGGGAWWPLSLGAVGAVAAWAGGWPATGALSGTPDRPRTP